MKYNTLLLFNNSASVLVYILMGIIFAVFIIKT